MLNNNDMVHDHLQQVCHSHGGMLPEPRSEGENQFLDSLGSDMFPLGMTDRDVEGRWIWDSDQSNVTWTKWAPSTKKYRGRTGFDCALMIRRYTDGKRRPDAGKWSVILCDWKIKNRPASLVCQRQSGIWSLL